MLCDFMLAESLARPPARRTRPSSPSSPSGRTARGWLLAPILLAALSGCASVGYLTQAAHGEWQVLHERQPITRVIADPHTPAAVRTRLELVQDARGFAVSALDLPDNRSYRTYSDLRRPYVSWNVVAAPRFSVRPLHWCFPIAGCVSYRGYFHERSARAFAARLAARGDDVDVEGVTAYSTLGHFADPVLSSMLRYDELDLVGTIFHELAHQLYYVPGDSEFDESFAMTVQAEGLARWLAARGRSAELQQYLDEQRVESAIDHQFAAGRTELRRLYAEPLPPVRMAARKHEILQQIGRRVLAIEHRSHLRLGYDEMVAAGLNNASLALIGTYSDCIPGFERLLHQNDDRLPLFYQAVRRIGRDPQARRALCAPAAGGNDHYSAPRSAALRPGGDSHSGARAARLAGAMPSRSHPGLVQRLSARSE